MKILLIHPNFPAQFRHIAAALASDPLNEVIFVTGNLRSDWQIPGVEKEVYSLPDKASFMGDHLSDDFACKLATAKSVLDRLIKIRQRPFVPDVIIGYSGWGTTFFIKDVFPDVPFLAYFEWYYKLHGSNLDFDPDKPPTLGTALSIRLRNSFILNDLEGCAVGVTPTAWQMQQFPEVLRDKIIQLHDGIDIDFFRPLKPAGLHLANFDLSGVKKIITYTARGFEPYRGFPQFIETLAIVLEKDRECHVVVAGSDRVCYGSSRKDGKSYRQYMLEKVPLDMERVHFVGELSYGDYLKVLQHSSVHIYLTYPFVLSWSMLEAMACGCVVIASSTPPVKEVLEDGVNGILADFFSPQDIAAKIVGVLAYPSFTEKMRVMARKTIKKKYAIDKLLPQHLAIIRKLARRTEKSGPFG